jgi:hypothetical protein
MLLKTLLSLSLTQIQDICSRPNVRMQQYIDEITKKKDGRLEGNQLTHYERTEAGSNPEP